jgi:hypothetical protein
MIQASDQSGADSAVAGQPFAAIEVQRVTLVKQLRLGAKLWLRLNKISKLLILPLQQASISTRSTVDLLRK